MTCSCIAINHPLHLPGKCDEPPTWMYGICHTCRYADTFTPWPEERVTITKEEYDRLTTARASTAS